MMDIPREMQNIITSRVAMINDMIRRGYLLTAEDAAARKIERHNKYLAKRRVSYAQKKLGIIYLIPYPNF